MSNPKGNPATLSKYMPKWKNKNTRTIRVPIALVDEILDYAHKLDESSLSQVNHDGNGKASATTSQDQDVKLRQALTQVIEVLESVCETPHTSKFTKSLKTSIQLTAIKPLKALLQVNHE